jgi:GNAT superfamily N-acetyltransferase
MIRLLSTEKDNAGNTLKIKQTDSIKIPSLFTFYLRAYADIMEANLTTLYDLDVDDFGAVYAEIDDKIVGHIIYLCNKEVDDKNLYIVLSTVDKSYRRMGIYKILHKYFEDTARRLNCSFISSMVWKKNSVRLESIKSSDISLSPDFKLFGKRITD